MVVIKRVLGREVLDSRGNPTVEVEIHTSRGISRAIVPSGASKGTYEALELRDDDIDRYFGKGVLKAVNNVNLLGKKLLNKKLSLNQIDEYLINEDGTKNKKKYGANALLGISLAATKAISLENNEPLYKTFGKLSGNKRFVLPNPMFNIINGGMHAGNNLDFQEYIIIPNAKSFKERLRIGTEIYHELKEILKNKYGKHAVNVGDEGGFAPPLESVEEPMDEILEAADNLGYAKNIKIGLDVAANNLKVEEGYVIEKKSHDAFEMVDIYKELVKTYPILSIEDPFGEDDWENFYILSREIGNKVLVVGDDFLTTNKNRIEHAAKLKSCNAVILKMNQIGTVSQTIEAAKVAVKGKMKVIVSHRSGETEDASIADLSVGLGANFIKSGAPCRGERTAKYNQLLRVEENLK